MTIYRIKRFLRKVYNSIRFGRVRPVVKYTVAGTVAEIVYFDSKSAIVGYWAYGHFDPSFPYRE